MRLWACAGCPMSPRETSAPSWGLLPHPMAPPVWQGACVAGFFAFAAAAAAHCCFAAGARLRAWLLLQPQA